MAYTVRPKYKPISGVSIRNSLIGTSSIISKVVTRENQKDIELSKSTGTKYGKKLPIIYGETLINAQILGTETIRSDLDPSRIKKRYRMTVGEAGDDGNEGFGDDTSDWIDIAEKVIINGLPLLDKHTGIFNFADTVLKWGKDQIDDIVDPILNIFDIDPLTGKDIDLKKTIGKLTGTSNKIIDDVVDGFTDIFGDNSTTIKDASKKAKGHNSIPFFDANTGEWSTAHVNDVIKSANPKQCWGG